MSNNISVKYVQYTTGHPKKSIHAKAVKHSPRILSQRKAFESNPVITLTREQQTIFSLV